MDETECVPCKRDEHTRCRTYLMLYGYEQPCECWMNDHYGLMSAPDEPAADVDRADTEQRRYERHIGR